MVKTPIPASRRSSSRAGTPRSCTVSMRWVCLAPELLAAETMWVMRTCDFAALTCVCQAVRRHGGADAKTAFYIKHTKQTPL